MDSKMDLEKGYSYWTATVFMISINAGLGVLALPHALAGTGWYGILVIVLASVNSCYCSILLGNIWITMEKQPDRDRGKYRYPYPAMGMEAAGSWMRYLVTVSLHASALGLVVVYLLMSAQVAQLMFSSLFTLDYKFWIIILAAILNPLTWFGSIEKFQFAGIGALVSIIIACLVVFVGSLLDYSKGNDSNEGIQTVESISLSFGTILFAYGSVFFYPTVQNGMKNKQHYTKAALLANLVLLMLYVPISSVGYAVYGSSVNANLTLSLSNGNLRMVIEICLAIHCFLAFLLGVNPVMQEVEEALHVPPVFNYKRCIVRTFITFIILVISYTIPHFDKVINLVGGSTMTLLTFIFPILFYCLITKKDSKRNKTNKKMGFLEILFLLQIALVGVAGGISCTYFAVIDIAQIFMPHHID